MQLKYVIASGVFNRIRTCATKTLRCYSSTLWHSKWPSNIRMLPAAVNLQTHLPLICTKRLCHSEPQLAFSAILNHESRMLEIVWPGEGADVFPLVWLRDCCQCSNCFDSEFKARKTLMTDLDLEVKALDVKVSHYFHVVNIQSCYICVLGSILESSHLDPSKNVQYGYR